MIRPVWQLRPSSSAGRQEDNYVTNSHAVQDEGDNKDSQERGGGATRKSKWKIYKNPRLRKGFQYLKNYRRSATEPLRINKENSGECDNSDPVKKIPKSDKNWIRIQVTYDDNDKHCLDSVNKNSSVSEIVVNYNPNDSVVRSYNEKAVDVPKEYVAEKRFSTRRDSERWSQNKRSLNETVQDFLREDWIDNEYADNYCHRHTLTGFNSILDNKDIYLSRNYFIKPTYFNQQTMGINCSTKLGKLRKHSVVPADSGVIVYEKSTIEDNRQRETTKLNSPKRLTNTAHNRNPIPAFKVKSPPSYPDLFSVEESTSPCTSSTIEWDNILHRRNDINSPIPNPKLITSAKVQNSSKSAIEKISSPVPTPIETKQKNPFGSAFLRNFGGSYQNLVKVSKSDRIKSASENNLTKVSNAQMSKPVTKCASTLSTDYCPSVLYSRKQIADKATSNEWKSNLKNFKEKLFAMHLPKRKKSKEENRARSP